MTPAEKIRELRASIPGPLNAVDLAFLDPRDAHALLDIADKAEDLRAWVHALGNSEAWRGSMGDDGQGHDEGSTLAAMMLVEFDAALERLATKTPGDQE